MTGEYVLYAIEEDRGSDGLALMQRSDERGWGSPLVWMNEGDAQAVIDVLEHESGCHGDMRIVRLMARVRELAP